MVNEYKVYHRNKPKFISLRCNLDACKILLGSYSTLTSAFEKADELANSDVNDPMALIYKDDILIYRSYINDHIKKIYHQDMIGIGLLHTAISQVLNGENRGKGFKTYKDTAHIIPWSEEELK